MSKVKGALHALVVVGNQCEHGLAELSSDLVGRDAFEIGFYAIEHDLDAIFSCAHVYQAFENPSSVTNGWHIELSDDKNTIGFIDCCRAEQAEGAR